MSEPGLRGGVRVTEPEEVLQQEGASASGALSEALPGASDALPGAPEAPRPQGPLERAIRSAWRKLTTPTVHVPDDYRDRRLARALNKSLDKGGQGNAHKAMVGESTSLVVDHLMSGKGGQSTPLGHFAGSMGQYAYLSVDAPSAAPQAAQVQEIETPMPGPVATQAAPEPAKAVKRRKAPAKKRAKKAAKKQAGRS